MLHSAALDCQPLSSSGQHASSIGHLRKLMQMFLPTALLMDDNSISSQAACARNCSGHGECHQGVCLCEVEFSGKACDSPNLSYYFAFSGIFFALSAISFLQLILCIQSEFKRHKPHSIGRAFRVTTQKALYIVVGVASAVRGLYFQASLDNDSNWILQLRSAYYPLVLSGSSLLVCFWAEMFHLQDVSTERPGFLSKSFCGFALFNVITYSLFFAELFLLQYAKTPDLDKSTCLGIFNGIYASLMLVVVIFFLIYGVEVYFKVRGAFIQDEHPESDRSQLHQSRFGLISQAILLIFTVIFLMSDVLGTFWKIKFPVLSRNTHQIMFQVVELAVALWFPCCLWNCIRPEQLWILNPRKILKRDRRRRKSKKGSIKSVRGNEADSFIDENENDADDEGVDGFDNQSRLECWICYDSEKNASLIQPCNCKGDVSAVHHECLKQWLMESHLSTENIRCQVCKQMYNFSRNKIWLPAGLTLTHYLRTALILSIMIISFLGAYAIVKQFEQVAVRTMSVGVLILIEYLCLRSLGVNLLSAYQRAKFAAIHIRGRVLDQNDLTETESSEQNSLHVTSGVGMSNGFYHHFDVDRNEWILKSVERARESKSERMASNENRQKILSFIRATLIEQSLPDDQKEPSNLNVLNSTPLSSSFFVSSNLTESTDLTSPSSSSRTTTSNSTNSY